jgi:hypothetical protein
MMHAAGFRALGALGAIVATAFVTTVHAGTAEVRFTEPGKFVDAGRGAVETGRTTAALGEHLTALARQLPASQVLRVEVLDVDLAGELEWHRSQEIRVLKGRADWPRITLRWQLEDGGRPVASGEDRLSDMAYLQTGPGADGEAFAYEKRMLARWFAERFAGSSK